MKIKLIYCFMWNYESEAVSLAEKVLEEFKDRVDQLVLVPGQGGAFELFKDGNQIYSKLDTGEFPEESSMIEKLKK